MPAFIDLLTLTTHHLLIFPLTLVAVAGFSIFGPFYTLILVPSFASSRSLFRYRNCFVFDQTNTPQYTMVLLIKF
jgi:hypothetical protein